LQDWREKVGVGSILEQPQPFFDFAKGMYTHGLVCFAKNGAPVWLDKVGEMKREWAAFKVLAVITRSTCKVVQWYGAPV
jgi:hypothetical protein